MKKYKDINDEFEMHSKLSLPFNDTAFNVGNYLLRNNKKELESDGDISISTHKIVVDGCNIPLYVFSPKNIECSKAMLYIHGGGFAYKGYFKHYRLCRRYALEGECVVVYVDYRLLPKYKFPCAVHDCYEAYKWIIDNSEMLGIDKNKIIVGGDSAGGCLSCDVVRSAYLDKNIMPSLVLLLYPGLDKRSNTNSMNELYDSPIWDKKSNKKMWELYLGDSHYVSPGELDDVSYFPKTYVEVCEFDCLKDEGILFANKLKSCGVDVYLKETKGTIHGFDIKPCTTTEDAIKERINMIKVI